MATLATENKRAIDNLLSLLAASGVSLGSQALNEIANLLLTKVREPSRWLSKNITSSFATREQLEKAMQIIDSLPWQDRDILGDIYEYMLLKHRAAGINGQFRTPRHLLQFVVALAEPKPGESICDPACGSGGFLTEALKAAGSAKLRGYDIDSTMLHIARANLLLYGYESEALMQCNPLSKSFEMNEAFDLILANPPFSGTILQEELASDLPRVSKTEILFLWRILSLLKPGGRSAVIVPNGILFGSSKAHMSIRKALIEENTLQAVIALPQESFRPFAGVGTAILLFSRGSRTNQVLFATIENDGFSRDSKRVPIEENDLPAFLNIWRNKRDSELQNRASKAFFVPASEIAANGYDLYISRYSRASADYKMHDPKEILQRLKEIQEEIQRDIESLEKFLCRDLKKS